MPDETTHHRSAPYQPPRVRIDYSLERRTGLEPSFIREVAGWIFGFMAVMVLALIVAPGIVGDIMHWIMQALA